MKYNKIVLFFSISLALGTIMRFFQIKYTITYATGFFVSALSGYGHFIIAIILGMAILNAVFAMTYYKRPDNPPQTGIVLAITSFMLSASILFEVFTERTVTPAIPLQSVLLKIFGMLAAAYFVLYGLDKFFDTRLPDMTATIPVIYIIMRIICDFAAVSSLALISDYVFLILGYCVILLFFINFLKLYNGIDNEYNFRKILATGLASAAICIPQTISHIAVNAVSDGGYVHISHAANGSMLAFGLFIIAFVFTHFSKENTLS